MDFFENASIKFKRMQNINSLGGEVTKLEKANTELIAQLGQAYYDAHGGDPYPEFPNLVNQINENKRNIAKLQEEIAWKKSLLKCRNCGADLKESQQFCPVCGTKVVREMPKSESGPVCANCGAALAAGTSFCPKCGMPVNAQPQSTPQPAPQPIPDPIPQPVPQAAPQPAPAEEATICPNCGKQLRPGAKFCSGCGLSL